MPMKNLSPDKNIAGFITNLNRQAKADKIKLILDEARKKPPKPVSKQRLLDIGTGNGEIAGYLS